ncbi:PIG-L family deacetylase [Rubrolithibacter danxiaensis]|uniref:PIG-L family deacetylase n=1 Tax=Rubrolithibacter danxiaensis TaxID=3390805 RepID=UPI003BF77732
MKFRIVFLFLILIKSSTLKSQTATSLNAAEIKLKLQKLNTVGSVLYIAAHPDDENTRLLAYLANEKKVRTGYLSLTRGDGGQNLIGNEQAELLGLIRTQELLAARKTDGAEQFFTRANDFGFSKSADETFKIWDKEKILSDVIWVIRKFKPDVIITRFPEDARAGHGQHWASAVLAHEAFAAAADSKQFPEQLKYVQPWQTKRLLWNTYNFGGNNTTSNDQLKQDVGNYNPLLGKGYGEIAAESRSNHKSQGFGSSKIRGRQIEFFAATAGEEAKNNLFEGIDLTWNRLKGADKIAGMIKTANQEFDMENPSASVKQLISILNEVEKLKDDYWKTQKEKELKELIAACSGLWFESYSADQSVGLGDKVKVSHQYIVRSDVPVQLKEIKTGQQVAKIESVLKPEEVQSAESEVTALKITQPYWLAERHPLGSYTVKEQTLIGYPENPDPLTATYTFIIDGKPLSIDRAVVYKYTDPVQGEVYQPLVIAPPITASISEKALVFAENTPKRIAINLKAFSEGIDGTLKITVPEGWKVSPGTFKLHFTNKGEEDIKEISIVPDKNAVNGNLSLQIETDGEIFKNGLRVIKHSHIPTQTLFPLAEAELINVDIKISGKRIGYIAGAGDLVPESLKQIGYQVIMLSENSILNSDLSDYDAIIAGVRAYNVNNRLNYIQPKLMEYVKNGGTLLVQYNVNNGLATTNIGPYPFTITRNRVTDETAEVKFLNKDNPAFNYPNKITAKDFEGWVQERGLYFVADFDKNYTPLLSMKDAGEPENNGSLIVGKYGKGKFVYTSLAFFRQLPAGVPGAFRLFVNLLAKNKD